jgi:hypothetical protein
LSSENGRRVISATNCSETMVASLAMMQMSCTTESLEYSKMCGLPSMAAIVERVIPCRLATVWIAGGNSQSANSFMWPEIGLRHEPLLMSPILGALPSVPLDRSRQSTR